MQKRSLGVVFAYIGVMLMSLGGSAYASEASLGEGSTKEVRTYVVSQDGTGDYQSIQDAVDAAKSGDTILIQPGIYYESVKIYEKAVNLQGTGKDNCIIQYDGNDYDNPPLDLSSGTVSNLTIQALASDISFLEECQAYAVHIDKEPCGSKDTIFQNCRIISETSACFGIGLWGEQRVYIVDCEIVSKSFTPNIYIHDVEFPPYGGEAWFTMEHCVLERDNYGYVILAHAILPSNLVHLTFKGVQDIYADDLGNSKVCIENKYNAEGFGWCGLNNIFLTEESESNSIDEMNYVFGMFEGTFGVNN